MWLVLRCRLAAEMALKTGRECWHFSTRAPHAAPTGLPIPTPLPCALPDPPFSLRGESLGLVVAGGGGDDFVTMLVDSTSLGCSQLRLFLGLLLNLSDLLPLLWWCWDLHPQDDVPNFWLCQRCHIHTVGTVWVTPQWSLPLVTNCKLVNWVRNGAHTYPDPRQS